MKAIKLNLNERQVEVLYSIFGQLSDGIWENDPDIEWAWVCADIVEKDNDFYLVTYNGSPYEEMTRKEVLIFFANKAEEIVKRNSQCANIYGKSKSDYDFAEFNHNRAEFFHSGLTISEIFQTCKLLCSLTL